MPEFDQEQLRKWAVSGAERRLLEIATEAAAIYRAFPELRQRGTGGRATENTQPAAAAGGGGEARGCRRRIARPSASG